MSPPELNVTPHAHGSTVVLALTGHLNSFTVEALENSVNAVLSTDVEHLIFDCHALSFTSSAGLRVFLSTAKQMKNRGGTCAFARLTPTVNEAFEMAGFLDAMDIHSSVEDALVSAEL